MCAGTGSDSDQQRRISAPTHFHFVIIVKKEKPNHFQCEIVCAGRRTGREGGFRYDLTDSCAGVPKDSSAHGRNIPLGNRKCRYQPSFSTKRNDGAASAGTSATSCMRSVSMVGKGGKTRRRGIEKRMVFPNTSPTLRNNMRAAQMARPSSAGFREVWLGAGENGSMCLQTRAECGVGGCVRCACGRHFSDASADGRNKFEESIKTFNHIGITALGDTQSLTYLGSKSDAEEINIAPNWRSTRKHDYG